MIINHNISALNTLNRLNKNNKATANVMEKLSSGLRVNKASDDSAGLAISEKMRAQIRGLGQAQRNIQDGVSLIQTAESGLSNIQDPNLLRLRELAIQAANDTLTDDDRQQIQKEVEQIKQGINEIANNTKFNGINLLNVPPPENKTITETVMQPQTTTVMQPVEVTTTIPSYEEEASLVNFNNVESITIYEVTDGITHEITYPMSTFIDTTEDDPMIWSPPNNMSGEKYEFSSMNGRFTSWAYGDKYMGGDLVARNNITGVKLNGVTGYETNEIWGIPVSGGSSPAHPDFELPGGIDPLYPITNGSGDDLTDYPEFLEGNRNSVIYFNFFEKKKIGTTTQTTTVMQPVTTTTLVPVTITREELLNPPLLLQVGPNSRDNFEVKLTDARTQALGIDEINFSTRQGAESAIIKIDKAIETVSSERGKFGAYQNRLEHTLNNNSNYEMNLTAAESRIRDANMAQEMVEMTKNQILSQASQAMLTHASQQPQRVLDLLK